MLAEKRLSPVSKRAATLGGAGACSLGALVAVGASGGGATEFRDCLRILGVSGLVAGLGLLVLGSHCVLLLAAYISTLHHTFACCQIFS